jgi:hypothetical protein
MLDIIIAWVCCMMAFIIAALEARPSRSVYGRGEVPTLFHGSNTIIAQLTPRPSAILDGEAAVFATSDYLHAVIFSAQWTDYNFSLGTHNGTRYLAEMYPGAFDKLNVTGYVHHVPAELFHRDSRTGMSNEYVAMEPIEPLSYDTVNVWEYLQNVTDGTIKLITYEELTRAMETNPRVPLFSAESARKIKHIYVPIDQYWTPKEEDVRAMLHTDLHTELHTELSDELPIIIYFNNMNTEELTKALDGASSVVLVGDIAPPGPDCLYDFMGVPVTLLDDAPPLCSRKTTPAEYARYMAARRVATKVQ